MAEWDNVQSFGDSRLNLGAKVYVTPYFHFNVAVRELGGGSRFSDGTDSATERIVQLKYVGNF
jgi:hypothetical protein